MTDRDDDKRAVDQACAVLRDVLTATKGMDRRGFLYELGRAVAGSVLLAPLAGLAANAQGADQPVTAFVYGGPWKAAIMAAYGDPFTKKTGIPVRYQEPYSFAKLRAMHDAKAQQIDAVNLAGTEVFLAERMKMLTPLDWTVIDRTPMAPRQLRRPNLIGSHTQSMNVCYSTKKFPAGHHPNSWADLWDVEKFPGRRSLRRDATWTVEAAALADGIKESEFYPLDVDRVFRSLERIKPHVKTWWSDNSQAQQLMEAEEVDLIMMANGRATQSILEHKAPFEMVWNEALCDGDNEGWIVPVGCPNPKGAMRFLDIVGRAEFQAIFARMLYYAPQNPKAFELLDPALAKLMPSYSENEKIAHMINFNWWADNQASVQRRFEQWLQS